MQIGDCIVGATLRDENRRLTLERIAPDPVTDQIMMIRHKAEMVLCILFWSVESQSSGVEGLRTELVIACVYHRALPSGILTCVAFDGF